MKVVHINAGINSSSAPYKLHIAMKQQGIDSYILTMNSSGINENENVIVVSRSLSYRLKRKLRLIRYRLLTRKMQLKSNMPIDLLPIGMDISNNKYIKEADIICVHWVCADFLSEKEIEKMVGLNKPVIQFCHDNYPFTGGCHVRMGCDGYKNGCKECPQITGGNSHEIINQAIKAKKNCYANDNVRIVSPSNWMDGNVAESLVLNGKKHFVLPNVIDVDKFKPSYLSLEELDNKHGNTRDSERNNLNKSEDIQNNIVKLKKKYGIPEVDLHKKIILCPVKANENIPYNGMKYLWETIEKINDELENVIFVAFGVKELTKQNRINMLNLGYITSNDDLAEIYSMSDVMLVTSLEDSFNQTVAECMACGTPVVAFNNGGIADIIDHQINGYMAKLYDTNGLTEGIKWVLEENIDIQIIRKKIAENFSSKVVMEKWEEIILQINL